MIDVKETSQLQSMLEKAINEAKENKTSRLTSITKKINICDPVLFFEAGKKLSMDRTFWSSTAENFQIAGVGNAFDLEAESNQMEQVEAAWKKLLDEAIIHNPYETPGTGVVTMGGMSFDSTMQKSVLWQNFSHLSFTIPEIMLTKWKDTCYLTINIQAGEDDHAADLANKLKGMENKLLNHSGSLPEGTHIEKKEEIGADVWKETVKFATDYIKQNHANKIVLARKLLVKLEDEAVVSTILNKLIDSQSNSYVFAFERNGDCFIGASPERLVRQEKEKVLSTCLAGTAPRGQSEEADARFGNSLLHDPKNRSEHDFVVQMIRESMESCCHAVNVPDKPTIYPLKNLQHLYTPVTATLNEGYSIFDIIGKLHPTPALGGVPREKSLQFIREHEQLDRGWYGAPIGWLDSNHNGEFAVAIRSGLIQGDQATLFAGGGIMKDSDPEAEYDETNIKFLPMLSVLGDER